MRGVVKKWDLCKSACVQSVETVCVFLSDPWINAWTANREKTELSVGWDRIKGTSVESWGQNSDLRSSPLKIDHRMAFSPRRLALCLSICEKKEKGRDDLNILWEAKSDFSCLAKVHKLSLEPKPPTHTCTNRHAEMHWNHFPSIQCASHS